MTRDAQVFFSTALIRAGSIGLALLLMVWTTRGHSAEPLQGPADAGELERFVDAIFAEQMAALHIPGAAFALVQDGKVMLIKGYGFANLEERRPVVADTTLFRVGSVSKVVTATALMQLSEQGRLDLHADVNRYLHRFQIAPTFPAPVTAAHLLTHTGGFDERLIGMAAASEAEATPLGEYLAARMPPRVRPPGDVSSYSNHGMALAGFLVEEITGMRFQDYVQANIFEPLGMRRSSFAVPSHLAPDLATGYIYVDGAPRAIPLDSLTPIAPAGSLSTTASDMARFMIAHLQDGRLGAAHILRVDTAQEMHRRQFSHHPRLFGFAYGFYENDGVFASLGSLPHVLQHDGGWMGVAAKVVLLPEQNVGFFEVNNTVDIALHEELTRRVLEHYFPSGPAPAPPAPRADLRARTARFAGNYRHNRYAQRTLEKQAAMGSEIRITADADGILTFHETPPTRWVEVEPLVFRRMDRDSYAAFREDAQGRITHVFVGISAFERLAWYESARQQVPLLGGCALVFLSAALGWPVVALIRRRRVRVADDTATAGLAAWIAGVVSWASVALLVSSQILLSLALQLKVRPLLHGMTPAVLANLCVANLIAVVTIALPVFTLLAWTRGWWSPIARMHYTLVTLAAVYFVLFLAYWNQLGFRY